MANLQILKHYARHPREFLNAVKGKLWSFRPVRMIVETFRNLFHINRVERRVAELEEMETAKEIRQLKARLALLEGRAAGIGSPIREMVRRAGEQQAKARQQDSQRQQAMDAIAARIQAKAGGELRRSDLTTEDLEGYLRSCQGGSLDLIRMCHVTESLTLAEIAFAFAECARVLAKDGELVIEAADAEGNREYHVLADPNFATVLSPKAMEALLKAAGLTVLDMEKLAEAGEDICAGYILQAARKAEGGEETA